LSHTGPENSAFHTTRWTMVMRARGEAPEARAALGELCENYWTPVFQFLRREGKDEDQSRELTQEFFSRVLSGGGIEGADPTKGRFRSYLLGALKHFLAKQSRDAGRMKRGGDAVVESMDTGGSETSPGFQVADSEAHLKDPFFDRHWAMAVIQRGLTSVEQSYSTGAKAKQFELLKPWLMGDAEGTTQAEVAAELGMTPGAVKVAIHRFRHKFGEAIRSEIAETEIQEELRYLIEVLHAR